MPLNEGKAIPVAGLGGGCRLFSFLPGGDGRNGRLIGSFTNGRCATKYE